MTMKSPKLSFLCIQYFWKQALWTISYW